MTLGDVIRDTLHAENLDIQARSVGERVFNDCEGLLVDLSHVDRQA